MNALLLALCLIAAAGAGDAVERSATTQTMNDPRYEIGQLLFSEDFDDLDDLQDWAIELEKGGTVTFRERQLVIDVPGGCTVWFKPPLHAPVMIQYEATVIGKGGPNDRVSDLNCFWMATDARSPDDLFATPRSGRFADYDQLRTYYVGLGGNSNTTTRFRRYIGEKDNRPLLPEHDLGEKEHLIEPNVAQQIRLVAAGPLIQYWRDDKKVFELTDPEPYVTGHFGFRTVTSHLTIRNFRVYQLKPKP